MGRNIDIHLDLDNRGIEVPVVDDHNSGRDFIVLDAVVKAIYPDGRVYITGVPKGEHPYFCLNDVYLDEDGRPHLSTFTVLGTVMGDKLPMYLWDEEVPPQMEVIPLQGEEHLKELISQKKFKRRDN